jgi:hypothetical protein
MQVFKERNFPYSSIKMLASARWVCNPVGQRQPEQQQLCLVTLQDSRHAGVVGRSTGWYVQVPRNLHMVCVQWAGSS